MNTNANETNNNNTNDNSSTNDSTCKTNNNETAPTPAAPTPVTAVDENKNEESYTDITHLMEQASNALSYTNPILTTNDFDLYDSMAALELMHPKMDSCQIDSHFYNRRQQQNQTSVSSSSSTPPTTTSTDSTMINTTTDSIISDSIINDENNKKVPPRPAPKSLNDKFTSVPWNNLTIQNATTIALQIMSCLQSFLNGSSIAESIYTCYYAHDDLLFDMKCHLFGNDTSNSNTTSNSDTSSSSSSTLKDVAIDDDIIDATATAITTHCTITSKDDKDDEGTNTSNDNNNINNKTTTTTTTTNKYNKTNQIKIAQKSVYASALLMVKASELLRDIVLRADIFEEEDFTITCFNFTFFAPFKKISTFDFQSTAVNTAANGGSGSGGMSGDTSGNSENNGTQENHDSNTQTNGNKDDITFGESMENALHVGRTVIQDLTMIKDEKNVDVEGLTRSLEFLIHLCEHCHSLSNLTKDNLRTTVTTIQKQIQESVSNLDLFLHWIENKWNKSKHDDNQQQQQIISQTFDPYVNRHLLGSAPVRKTNFETPLKSIQYFHTILQHLDTIVCTLLLHGTSLSRIQRMLSHISQSCSANILIRSLIVINLYFDDLLFGQHILGYMIASHMHIFGVPKSYTNTTYGINFLNRLGKPIYDVLKLMTFNRNRQRHFLEMYMLHDWNVLQEEASVVDHSFRQEFELSTAVIPFMTNYIISYTIRLMEHHMSLGIELELFTGSYHLSTAYWYYDFLLSTQLNIVVSMKESLLERRSMEERQKREEALIANVGNNTGNSGGGGGGGKGKKKGKKKSSKKGGGGNNNNNGGIHSKPVPVKPTIEEIEDDLDFMLLGLKRTLCRGIVRFIAALNQAGILSPPNYLFTTNELCFQKRFEAFTQISRPPPLTHGDYLDGSDFKSVSSKELLASTSECFKSGRAVLQKIMDMIGGSNTGSSGSDSLNPLYCCVREAEAMKLTKVCVANSLFVHKLTQLVREMGNTDGTDVKKKVSVSFDFTTHCQFCSVKLN